mmetsp:Transcript_24558/g.78982  ORF Transcript_24558/g.78982 Transcript_24558/m.78982 type:complete len:281 (+) Transcript_24558:1024-1866(+)
MLLRKQAHQVRSRARQPCVAGGRAAKHAKERLRHLAVSAHRRLARVTATAALDQRPHGSQQHMRLRLVHIHRMADRSHCIRLHHTHAGIVIPTGGLEQYEQCIARPRRRLRHRGSQSEHCRVQRSIGDQIACRRRLRLEKRNQQHSSHIAHDMVARAADDGGRGGHSTGLGDRSRCRGGCSRNGDQGRSSSSAHRVVVRRPQPLHNLGRQAHIDHDSRHRLGSLAQHARGDEGAVEHAWLAAMGGDSLRQQLHRLAIQVFQEALVALRQIGKRHDRVLAH